jgi:cystathionine beta-lyase family protein involved in aluminum resistance
VLAGTVGFEKITPVSFFRGRHAQDISLFSLKRDHGELFSITGINSSIMAVVGENQEGSQGVRTSFEAAARRALTSKNHYDKLIQLLPV